MPKRLVSIMCYYKFLLPDRYFPKKLNGDIKIRGVESAQAVEQVFLCNHVEIFFKSC